MTISNDKIASLKQAHGEVWQIDFPAGFSIMLKRPTGPQFERYMSLMVDPQKRIQAHRMFAIDVVVEPSGDALTAIIDKYPGAVIKIANTAAQIAAAEEVESGKAL
jgi:hypothetical protein